jgi:hypothetical protein
MRLTLTKSAKITLDDSITQSFNRKYALAKDLRLSLSKHELLDAAVRETKGMSADFYVRKLQKQARGDGIFG